MLGRDICKAQPFVLSLSKDGEDHDLVLHKTRSSFDRLRTNGFCRTHGHPSYDIVTRTASAMDSSVG